MNDVKLCTSCAEPIATAAVVCKHCQRAQGWHAHFESLLRSLPLILATLSALAAVLAFARPWVFPPQSQLVASFQRYANERVSFLVTNLGDRAGAVEQLELRFWHENLDQTGFDLPVREEDNTLVQPGTSVLVTPVVPENLKKLIWLTYQMPKTQKCSLAITLMGSEGNRERRTVDTICWEAVRALLPERRREIIDSLPDLAE
jgi:hypothetical protein